MPVFPHRKHLRQPKFINRSVSKSSLLCVSYVFEKLSEVELSKSIDGIVEGRVSSSDRSIELLNRVVHQMRTGNDIILQVVDLLKQRLIMV